jgi:hypothetical protein
MSTVAVTDSTFDAEVRNSDIPSSSTSGPNGAAPAR